LIFPNVSRAYAIRTAVEASRKLFDCVNVGTYGIVSVIKTLELIQHHFSEMGHRDLLVTQNLLQQQAQLLRSIRVASAARAATF